MRKCLRSIVAVLGLAILVPFLSRCGGTSGGGSGSNPVAPSISAQPTNATVTAGQTVNFSVTATGTPAPTYQWYLGTAPITGATAASYSVPNTTLGMSGEAFYVIASNSAGSATSNTVTLTVNAGATAPSITQQPTNVTVSAGQTAAFSVTATGSPAPTYQWYQGTTSISGATSASYNIPNTTVGLSGETFYVIATNSAGSATSNTVTLTVNPVIASSVNVLTYHNDNGRTGQNVNETILTTSNVKSSTFGKLGFLSVTGLVDAEPLYASNLKVNGASHNVVYVATEHDLVYAFDADNFAQLWQVSMLGANETTSDNRGCDQVTPEIGVTSTPVIDLKAGPHGTIFVVSMTKDSGGNYHHRLHALDLTTGAEQTGSPVTISASFTIPNSNGQLTTFAPAQYKERAALLLLNGVVYLAFSSHCDDGPYQGWLMSYNETSLAQVSVLNVTPNGGDGAIWMAGDGLAADASNNIYFLDGNGTFDTSLNANGFPSDGDYGNAFIKVSTTGNIMQVADYFNMHNTVSESNSDEDLGSGGEIVLPDLVDGGGKTWHLAVGAGKDKNIYLVNRDSMGKFNASTDSAIYQEITSNGLDGGVWAMPAYFNNTIYYAGVGDTLKAFSIVNAKIVAPPGSQSSASYSYPGAIPSVSANGTTNGIVWAVQNSSGGVLHAYDATNLSNELYNSNQATGGRDQFSDNKFITPMIANGKVYVGTPTGVIVFGVLP
jgi:Immunoglobulin domain/Immunoglobulin I-set domain